MSLSDNPRSHNGLYASPGEPSGQPANQLVPSHISPEVDNNSIVFPKPSASRGQGD